MIPFLQKKYFSFTKKLLESSESQNHSGLSNKTYVTACNKHITQTIQKNRKSKCAYENRSMSHLKFPEVLKSSVMNVLGEFWDHGQIKKRVLQHFEWKMGMVRKMSQFLYLTSTTTHFFCSWLSRVLTSFNAKTFTSIPSAKLELWVVKVGEPIAPIPVYVKYIHFTK